MRGIAARGIVRVGVSVGLLAALLLWIDLGEVGRLLGGASVAGVALLLGVVTADRLLMAWKWWRLLRANDVQIGLGEAIRSYYVASFSGIFLPVTIGADLVRAAALRHLGETPRIVSSILLERGIGAVAQLALAAASLVLFASIIEDRFGPAAKWAIAVLLAAGLAAVPASFAVMAPIGRRLGGRPGVRGIVGKVAVAYAEFGRRRGAVVTFSTLTFLETLFPVAMYAAAARALGLATPLSLLFATVPIAFLVARLPVSLGGIGILEGSFVVLGRSLGMATSDAAAVALLAQIAVVAAVLPGAFGWRRAAELRSGPREEERLPDRADVG